MTEEPPERAASRRSDGRAADSRRPSAGAVTAGPSRADDAAEDRSSRALRTRGGGRRPEHGRAGAHRCGRARCSGTAPGDYGKPREIWFDPAPPEDPLPNPHISITGETGCGKTQATKAILARPAAAGLPRSILDFKDDYSEPVYAETEGFNVYDAELQQPAVQPAGAAVDPASGRVNPTHHIHQLADIIKRIYRLGDQQAYRLREAMKKAYEDAGIAVRAGVARSRQAFPPFEAVRDELAEDKDNEALLGRLSPIFDLGLFQPPRRAGRPRRRSCAAARSSASANCPATRSRTPSPSSS